MCFRAEAYAEKSEFSLICIFYVDFLNFQTGVKQ